VKDESAQREELGEANLCRAQVKREFARPTPKSTRALLDHHDDACFVRAVYIETAMKDESARRKELGEANLRRAQVKREFARPTPKSAYALLDHHDDARAVRVVHIETEVSE
jgi:hypothetical protein